MLSACFGAHAQSATAQLSQWREVNTNNSSKQTAGESRNEHQRVQRATLIVRACSQIAHKAGIRAACRADPSDYTPGRRERSLTRAGYRHLIP